MRKPGFGSYKAGVKQGTDPKKDGTVAAQARIVGEGPRSARVVERQKRAYESRPLLSHEKVGATPPTRSALLCLGVRAARLGVQVPLEKCNRPGPGVQGCDGIFTQGLVLQECVSHVGIDFELENLSQLLHVGCSSGHLGSQSGVIIARKGEDWSLYLCHCGEVRRGAIEAYGSVYPRYLRSAFPSKASAVADAGDTGLVVAERLNDPRMQLQGTLCGVRRDIHPLAMARRFVHNFHGAAEMAGHHVGTLGDLLLGIALTGSGSGRSGVILRLRRRGAPLRPAGHIGDDTGVGTR